MSQDVNYIPYYRLVNKAKLAKCQQNYDSALVYYAKAFEMVDYILFNDLCDFTKCAIATHKDSLVYFAMQRCNIQNIFVGFIIPSDSACEKYKQTEYWNTCTAYEKENEEIYIEKFITTPAAIVKILDSLSVSDVAVRRNWTWYCSTFRKSKLSKKRKREWRVADSCNQRVVDEMIQKYGFPNERIGCPNNYHFYLWGSGLVFVHYDDTNFFRNVEYKALLEGKLSPECYADRAQRMASIFKWDKLQYTYYTSKRNYKRMTPQEKEQIDKNRYAIGLPSVEEEKKIRQYNYQEYQKRKAAEKVKAKQQK